MGRSDESFLSDIATAFADVFEEPYHDYWFHLGKFVHSFSRAEANLLEFLRNHAKAPDEILAVLLSGTRVDTAKDYINKILEVTNQHDVKGRLEKPFAQLKTINTVRNNIVHWGAYIGTGGNLLISNERAYVG
jgi:hypothetical protein